MTTYKTVIKFDDDDNEYPTVYLAEAAPDDKPQHDALIALMYEDAEIDEWSPNPADWKPGPLARRIVRLLNEKEIKRAQIFAKGEIAL